MSLLFITTDTTGTDPKTARLVRLTWLLTTKDGEILDQGHNLVRPNGYPIPQEAVAMHGITTYTAMLEGRDLKNILSDFVTFGLIHAGMLIAHGLDFEKQVILKELSTFFGEGILDMFANLPGTCTQEITLKFCSPNDEGCTKNPSLKELYEVFFRKPLPPEIAGIFPTATLARCYFEMRKRQIIPAP
ncbi:MAG: 3'-5' exonuclease [Saprospiraceae bacterium]|nr:3'-5' exonuclease [Saprospiraceae bacterium]